MQFNFDDHLNDTMRTYGIASQSYPGANSKNRNKYNVKEWQNTAQALNGPFYSRNDQQPERRSRTTRKSKKKQTLTASRRLKPGIVFLLEDSTSEDDSPDILHRQNIVSR